MKTTRNNKGAAMVSVLIAVSFIIILASSLMYMSYMNYITKGMRYQGTDNFYTDEFALDDLCMTMQQIAASCENVSDAKDALLSDTRGVGRRTSGSISYYDNNCVARLMAVAGQEASISVNTIYDTSVSSNLIVSSNSIQLLGLEITSITDSGYQSTICTDIMLTFPNGGLGDLDINDFSVIGDSPITIDEGDVFFSGCVYIDSRGGSTALTVNSAGNVHILAPRGIINGDIVINGTGQLSITGIVTVNGDIYVRDNAVLLCSDQLKHTGRIIKDPNARVLGHDTFGPDTINTSSLPTNGLGEKLLTNIWARDEGGYFHELTLDDFQNAGGHLKYIVNEQDGRPEVKVMIGMQNPENRNENSLVLSTGDVTIKGVFENSTIVCGGTIIFQERSMPTYMQSMSDEAFEAAKMGVMGSGGGGTRDERNSFGFSPILGGGHGNYNFAGSQYSDIPTVGVADNYYDWVAPGGEVRYYIYKNHQNYVPFGYFIADNSSQIITDVFSGVQGNADPVHTNIFVTNWVKE